MYYLLTTDVFRKCLISSFSVALRPRFFPTPRSARFKSFSAIACVAGARRGRGKGKSGMRNRTPRSIFALSAPSFSPSSACHAGYFREREGCVKLAPFPKAYIDLSLSSNASVNSSCAHPPPRANPWALALFLFWVANSRGWG